MTILIVSDLFLLLRCSPDVWFDDVDDILLAQSSTVINTGTEKQNPLVKSESYSG